MATYLQTLFEALVFGFFDFYFHSVTEPVVKRLGQVGHVFLYHPRGFSAVFICRIGSGKGQAVRFHRIFRYLQCHEVDIATLKLGKQLKRVAANFHAQGYAQTFRIVGSQGVLKTEAFVLIFKIGVWAAERGNNQFT